MGRNNEYHDTHSNYCISRLLGGEIINGGRNIDYPNGGYILVTSVDNEFLNKVIMGILQNTTLGYGMEFSGMDHITEEFYNGWNYFKTTTAGFLLANPDGGYYTLEDDIQTKLTDHIKNKFSKINPKFDFTNLKVEINVHPNHQVRSVYSKNVKNIINICQINVYTNKNIAEALYNYGIGKSCGSGFGTIYTTQHLEFYK
jgi:CRISPR-associated endoribonuclease Cas6